MAKPENFDVQVIIDHLQGTCNTLSSAVEECFEGMTEDDLNVDDHNAIDNQIFLCEECRWWCEVGAESSNADDADGYCKDCKPDDDE